MRSSILALFLSSWAAIAAADCPTAADLAGGEPVFLKYEDGWVVEFRLTSDGLVAERARSDHQDTGYRLLSIGGVVGVDSIETLGPLNLRRSRIFVERATLRGVMDTLPPSTDFSVEGNVVFADGSHSELVRASVQTGEEGPVDVAGCSYEAIPVTIEYSLRGDPVTVRMDHLPDLGISVERSQRTMGGSTNTSVPNYFSATRP